MPSASVSTATAVNPGVLTKSAHAVTDVLDGVVDPARAAHVATGFLDLIETAEFQPRQSARLAVSVSLLSIFRDQPLEVIAQLGVQLIVKTIAADQTTPPGHDASPFAAFRIAATAPVKRSQLAVSDSRWVRPFRVSL